VTSLLAVFEAAIYVNQRMW